MTKKGGRSHRPVGFIQSCWEQTYLDTTLRLTVRARMGQTVEDLERAVPAIRDAAGAHSARSVVVSPGTLRIELVMREQLSAVGHAAPPTAVATARVTLGRCENGSAWTLPLSGRHTLTVGCSGAGKGSVFWGIACWARSCCRRRRGSPGGHRSEVRHRVVGRLWSVHQDRHHGSRCRGNPCRAGEADGQARATRWQVARANTFRSRDHRSVWCC